MKVQFLLSVSLFFVLNSCQNSENKYVDSAKIIISESIFKNKYAKLFSVSETKNGIKIRILDETGRTTDSLQISETETLNSKTIRPNPRIICLSTTHLAFLEFIEAETFVIAVSNPNFVYSPTLRKRAETGELKNIGFAEATNWELLINLKPDLVTVFDVEAADSQIIKQLERFKIPYLMINEYREPHILGQTEWAKVFGTLYQKDSLCDAKLNSVFTEYEALTNLTKSLSDKPSVLLNMPWNGTWHVAGGRSNVAQLIADAGGAYIYSKNTKSDSYPISPEKILADAADADFWLNTGQARSISEIIETDKRLAHFKPLKIKQIYNRTKRVSENGGNDYMESGIVQPQLILRDLIRIFHPELLPDSTAFFYYEKLN